MEMVTKINQEIKTKNLTKMKHCKAGLEVHFKEAEGYNVSKTSTRRRKKRSTGNGWCFICVVNSGGSSQSNTTSNA